MNSFSMNVYWTQNMYVDFTEPANNLHGTPRSPRRLSDAIARMRSNVYTSRELLKGAHVVDEAF